MGRRVGESAISAIATFVGFGSVSDKLVVRSNLNGSLLSHNIHL